MRESPHYPDPYAHLSLPDRLELLAFEAPLAGLQRIALRLAFWEVIDFLRATADAG
jgi:hypothetical protein